MRSAKNTIFFLCIIFFWVSCKKDDVTTADIFIGLQLSTATAVGDGNQLVKIICEVNPNISKSKQEFVLKTSLGTFPENGKAEIIKKPEFKNGKFVIESSVQVTLSPGTMVISVEPNLPEEKTDYIIKDSVAITKSVPSLLKLQSSALGIGSNFQTELLLTGILSNANGGKVSTGYTMKVEDFLTGYVPANGRLREMNYRSNAESKINIYYGIGNLPIGTTVMLRAILLDENGNETTIKDSLLIGINL
ncbi:hypothetical protein [Chitinophaga filiformis]|uniref:Uncharacterized protein n=1 Tax=Chitinophaga filiformis TaxID=104663 RepID=A0A1G7M0K2_CHIFI|nr:hypothetical protein [Chitinophaga filiformis]SDF55203.1 hypothetical protein SAMN04488121_102247 [Chitinophaga filiformis]